MAFTVDDRVLETTATTGTGAVTLGGAVTGCKAFSAAVDMLTGNAIASGDVVPYYLEAVDANGNATGVYEEGLGTYTPGSLARTTVLRSSNSNTVVTLAGPTTRVGITLLANCVPWIDGDPKMRLPSLGTAAPTSPVAGVLGMYARTVAAKILPASIGQYGGESLMQANLARHKVGMWMPPGSSTTVPGVFAFVVPTLQGTATTRSPAATNILTRMIRQAYVSSTTAGNLAGHYQGNASYTTGSGTANNGSGFFYVCRFGTSDGATVSGARAFIGLSSNVSAATNVEPSTLTNSIGVGQLSTDATQWYLFYGGSAAQTAIALGTTLGAPTLTNTAFELALFAPSGQNGVVYYQVTNLGSGVTVTGTLSPATPGTQTPASTTFLAHRAWRCNNATALAVGIDICSVYVETDY